MFCVYEKELIHKNRNLHKWYVKKMDDDQKRFIVILVLLVVLVLMFFGIVFAIVYAMVKVNKVAAPIRSVVRVVKRIKNTKVKGVAKRVMKSIGLGVRKDLRLLAKRFRQNVKAKTTKLKTHIERAMTFLSGDPCAKFDQLWTQHVNLTFYYGLLTLTSLEPMTDEQKRKLDWVAGRLLDIQQELSNLMQTCVAESQRALLTQLLKDHILIVAQIADKWRKENKNGGQKPFDPQLVAAWYKNADDTVSLLESKTGKRDNNLQEQYRAHLNWTAGYLIEMTKNRGRVLVPTKKTFEVFAEALDHVPMLAAAFCAQMQACTK